jgi:hypothetical protein
MNMKTRVSGLRARTAMKVAALKPNHNETVATGLRVRTAVKAGALISNTPRFV